MVDRSLELDQRMSLVVMGSRQSFTVLAEVCVMADDTLVSHTLNVRLVRLALAKRTIAVDAMVRDGRCRTALEVLVDGSEAVAGVSVTSILVAFAAVVKVRTVETLVSHTMDHLVAAVADSSVSEVAAGREESLLSKRKICTVDSRLEVMAGVVTVGIQCVAVQAEVIIITLDACDKVAVGERNDTGVASAHRL